MEIIGFIFIWYWICKVAPHSKICMAIYRRQHRQWILERMEDSSGSEMSSPLLHRVLSASLDAEKSWFALNSVKCGGNLPGSVCQASPRYLQMNTDKSLWIICSDVMAFSRPPVGFWLAVVEQKMCMSHQPLALSLESSAKRH